MKKVAMIPLLLGSTRIKDKSLLLVHGQTMADYVIQVCKDANIFDEIYINSEHGVFKKLANKYNVSFYGRQPENGGSACRMVNKSSTCNGNRCQVNDHFLCDFMRNVESDYMFMVNATSPLLEPETIKKFVNLLVSSDYDSMFSVVEEYSESFVSGAPINFDLAKKKPTQELNPVQKLSWSISGWKRNSFLASYEKDIPNVQGPVFCGDIGLFVVNKIEALDVDDWEDLHLVESYLSKRHTIPTRNSYYLDDSVEKIDTDLERLIKEDGVTLFYNVEANAPLASLEEIKKQMGEPPWCYVTVYSDSDQACLICQNPGGGCRTHYHITKDEWWYIVEGEFEWHLKDRVIYAKKGDFVFLNKGTQHRILCVGNKPGIRLAHGSGIWNIFMCGESSV